MEIRMKNYSLLVLVLLFSSATFAQSYIGIKVSKTDYDIEVYPGESWDDPNGFGIYGGYNLNENLAIELAYDDFGDSNDNFDPEWTISASAISAVAIAKAPLNNGFTLYGKLGVSRYDVELDVNGNPDPFLGIFGNVSDDGTELTYGAGVRYEASEEIGLRLEYVFVDGDDSVKPSTLSIALEYLL